jgi:hypothetical protein
MNYRLEQIQRWLVEPVIDGWTSRYVGSKGVTLRTNPEHINRCVRAIINRFDQETEITIEETSCETQNLPRSSRVVSLEASRAKRKDRS